MIAVTASFGGSTSKMIASSDWTTGRWAQNSPRQAGVGGGTASAAPAKRRGEEHRVSMDPCTQPVAGMG